MAASERTLIVGIGNSLRSDDGVGPFVAEEIGRLSLPLVETLAVQQLSPELAPRLAAVARTIFVDAALGGMHEGPVVCEQLAADSHSPALTHHLTPALLVALAASLGAANPEAWLVTIPISQTDFGEGLSDRAKANSSFAVELICRQFLGGASHSAALPRQD